MRISAAAAPLTETLELVDFPQIRRAGFVWDRGGVYERTKRVLDVIIASMSLVLFAPFMLLVGVVIKLTSPGPAIFKQTRAGLGGRPFTMYKFRTMRDGAQDDRELILHLNEKDGPIFKIVNDPRMTLLGRFLRQSSVDELPQLFNILMGQMSLVGPRPLWLPEARGAAASEAALRMVVRPGLTCLWQISGRSELSYDQWVSLDLCYIEQRSVLLDLLILVQTIPAVLFGRGAY